MKAHLRSTRIAPKKANLVAKMVRGKPVSEALSSLERTNKKAARLLEGVIRSAAANAKQNDNQNPEDLIVKTLVVNKAITYHRGIPMARGRMRRIRKFLSHITVTLGYPESVEEEGKVTEKKPTEPKKPKSPKKSSDSSASSKSSTKKAASSSQKKKSPVKSVKKQSKKPEGSTKSKTTSTSKSSKSSKSS